MYESSCKYFGESTFCNTAVLLNTPTQLAHLSNEQQSSGAGAKTVDFNGALLKPRRTMPSRRVSVLFQTWAVCLRSLNPKLRGVSVGQDVHARLKAVMRWVRDLPAAGFLNFANPKSV